MKKVLLHYYAKQNLGDDLFVKIIRERYKNTFMVIAPSNNTYLKSLERLNLKTTKCFFYGFKVLEKTLKIRNIWLRLLAKKNDLLLYVGGSIFIENNNLSKWKQEEKFYRSLPIPYYILGSNFGPYKTQEFKYIAENIINGSADMCFRDEASYKLFEELKPARVATDIAFSLDVGGYKKENKKLAIFSVINSHNRFSSAKAKKYDSAIVDMTRQLLRKGYRVVYMSFCKFEGDEVAIDNIKNNLNSDERNEVSDFRYDGNLEEALELIANSDIVIGGRFHATVLGLLFSKKVLPMAYSDKTINLLNDMSYKGEIVDIRKIDAFDGSVFNFDKIPVHNIDRQVKRAEDQFRELDKALVRSRSE